MARRYIDRDALIAKIEKAIDSPAPSHDQQCDWEDGYWCGLSKAECIIDTIEVKEVENFIWNNARTTVPEDSTNQIICIKEDGLAVSTIGKIVNGTVKWAYLDDLLNTNSFNVEVKEVDLEKEIKEQIDKYYENCNKKLEEMGEDDNDISFLTLDGFARHFYELGIKAKGE